MNRRAAALLAYAAVAAASALVIPTLFLAGDPWADASRSIRALARPDDLVVLFPAARVDRLAAFDRTWAVAVDPGSVGRLDRFHRIFWIGEADVPPPAGLTVRWSRRFGNVGARLLESPRPSR